MVTMVKVKCIALKHYTMTLTGLEPRPFLPSNSEKELSEKEYALPSSPDFT